MIPDKCGVVAVIFRSKPDRGKRNRLTSCFITKPGKVHVAKPSTQLAPGPFAQILFECLILKLSSRSQINFFPHTLFSSVQLNTQCLKEGEFSFFDSLVDQNKPRSYIYNLYAIIQYTCKKPAANETTQTI